ncbi:MAG TPA: hypothetical protein VFF06_34810 [Polyangia bacterium]|nr:hypothetical protein [Polyangia bacterium]
MVVIALAAGSDVLTLKVGRPADYTLGATRSGSTSQRSGPSSRTSRRLARSADALARRRPVILDWIFALTDDEFAVLANHFHNKGYDDLVTKMMAIRQVGPAAP